VFKGRKTWIGYCPEDHLLSELPTVKPGILSQGIPEAMPYQNSEVHMINYIYAREYSVWKDIDVFLKNISKLI